jgi:UDPglucose 6-dehydrogenase
MNIGVIGLGKLGCSMFAAFAAAGNNVFGFDIDKNVRNDLRKKIAPVSETGLQGEINLGFENFKILDNTSQVIEKSDVIYVIVPTPSLKDGSFDTKYLENVILNISDVDSSCENKLIVITSTVLPGDTRLKLISKIRLKNEKISKIKFCYSPEFIALGSVLNDLKNPDFLLVGEDIPHSADIHIEAMMTIIKNKNIPIRRMSIESAEMAKISINSYITSKISFANAIGIASDNIENCSSKDVLSAIGSDSRIGKKYLNKGLGFGGPCFPRDNRAFAAYASKAGVETPLGATTDKFNDEHTEFLKEYFINKNKDNRAYVFHYLTYKDGVDILTESRPYDLALSLLDAGYEVYCLDSTAKDRIDSRIKFSDFPRMDQVCYVNL